MKNGKIFGKINAIDFIVLLVVLLAVAAVAVFIFMPKGGDDTLIMKFRIEEVDEFVAKKVKVGDPLYDDTFSLDLGEVTAVELDDSISYSQTDNDNIWSITSKEGYYSMIITGECNGTKTKLGAEIGGKKYGVGHSFVLRAGDAKLYLRVYDIQLKEDGESTVEDVENTANITDVTMSFYAPEVENFIAEKLVTDSKVIDILRKSELGTVTGVELGESESYDANNAVAPKAGYKSVNLFCAGKGEKTNDGVAIDGKVYRVGDEVEISVGTARITVKISEIG